MKQILQSFKTGDTILEEVPVPVCGKGSLLVQTSRSLVSLGTERMLVEFGKSNLVSKALQQPERVKQVIDKIKSDGLMPTLSAVFNKLDQPLPLGYCNVGKVVAVGSGVEGFAVGDRVASNGAHAEFVNVPKNLAAKIPGNVTDEQAAFTVIGSIGLQGIRLCNPAFGETIVVVGLGLIGLLTARMLHADGCNVIGIDIDEDKCTLARKTGIIALNPGNGSDPVREVMSITENFGADAVIITASAKTNDLIAQAAKMSRKRGRIILVGVIGLELNRADFYEKELTFQVSCSYGPGRYDDVYEKKGIDYPAGYVRWTEKRNFEAVLNALSRGILKVDDLVTEKVRLDNYLGIYGNMRRAGQIASIIEYSEAPEIARSVVVNRNNRILDGKDGLSFAVIGAGNFASATIVPALKKIKAPVRYIASANGVTSKILAKKGNINIAASDYKIALKDSSVGMVIIATRHDNHSAMCIEALEAGKHVFVEKPLALNSEQLDAIIRKHNENKEVSVSVGFNRRFSPLAIKMKKLLGEGPKNIVATMNAGFIPSNSWLHDLETGGGRIVGEACHYMDLCIFLAGSHISSVCMNSMGTNPDLNTDNASILVKFRNGSNAVINYFSNGSKKYSKERIEVYQQERTLIMDNWRSLKGYGFSGFSALHTKQDKGHMNQFRLLKELLQKGGKPLIEFEDIVNATRASFAALESLEKGQWIELP